jgi:phospholipase C
MQTRATRALIVSLFASLSILLAGCGSGPGGQSDLVPAPPGGVPGSFSFTPDPNPGPPEGVTPTDAGQVNHIVFMLQENRSFDMYFGKLNEYRAGIGLPEDVDDLPSGASNPSVDGSTTVTAFHLQTMCTEDLSPFWNESHVAFNKQVPGSNTPKLDGFVTAAGNYATKEALHDTAGLRAMGYYDASDIPFYYYLASQFAISDRVFAPVQTNTNSNRHYLYAATSSGHVYPWSDAPDSHKTIADLLEEKGLSWRIYAQKPSSSIFFEFATSLGLSSHVVWLDQFFTDAASGNLPAVAMVELAADDEHPQNNIQQGAAQAARIISALMTSPNWKDSAMFLSYDESGGLYDHVPPITTVAPDDIPVLDLMPSDICYTGCSGSAISFTRSGYRVPFILISPYAKPHYVSHTPADYTAVLKFIEDRFGLPRLSARDAAQPSLDELFDYSSPNLNPPTPPSQPTNGPCYFDHLP